MKHTSLLTFILIMLLTGVYGQGNFMEGFIITLEDEVVRGLVKDENINSKMINCSFRKRKSSGTVDYAPGEIIGYGFKDYRMFVSKPYISKDSTITGTYFYEVIFDGFFQILTLKEDGKPSYFISMDDAFYRLDEQTRAVWDDDTERNITETKKAYVGYLLYLFQDAPELRPAIEQTSLNPGSLIELGKSYHALSGDRRQSYKIPYYVNRMKVSFIPSVGFKQSWLNHSHHDGRTTRVNLVPSGAPEFGMGVEMQLPGMRSRPFLNVAYNRFNGNVSASYGESAIDSYETYIYADYSKITSNIGLSFPLQSFLYPSFAYCALTFGHLYDYAVYQFPQPPDEIGHLIIDDYRVDEEFGKLGVGASLGYQYRRGIHSRAALSLGVGASFMGVKFGDATRYIVSTGLQLGIILK